MTDPSPEALACAEAIGRTLFHNRECTVHGKHEQHECRLGPSVVVGMERQAVAELVEDALRQRSLAISDKMRGWAGDNHADTCSIVRQFAVAIADPAERWLRAEARPKP